MAVAVVDAVDEDPRDEEVEEEHQWHGDDVLAHSEAVGDGVHKVGDAVGSAEACSD